jgi:DNA invertase Pin-like site-specific DNA recombinase
MVWRLDRLGRSLPHLIETISELEGRGVGFRSLTEAIDTTTPGGRLIFHVFGALGQFERDLIGERTKAGLAAAAALGRKGGRKSVVSAEKLQRARDHIANGLNVREPCTAQGRQDCPIRRLAGGECRRLLTFCAFVF